jgi:hypothetical protein
MAFQAKDGKQFGNAQKQRRYDEVKAAAPKDAPKPDAKAEPKEAAKPAAKESAPKESSGGEDVSSQPIHEVVAAHGPAQRIIIDISPEGGHSVETHHNGKVHKAQFGSAEEADQHVKAATGTEAPADVQPPPECRCATTKNAAIPDYSVILARAIIAN